MNRRRALMSVLAAAVVPPEISDCIGVSLGKIMAPPLGKVAVYGFEVTSVQTLGFATADPKAWARVRAAKRYLEDDNE